MTLPRTPVERLKAARELLSDPAKWTQGAFARDEDGSAERAFRERACRWDMSGAVYRVSQTAPNHVVFRYLERIVGEDGVAHFNDTKSHGEILEAFDKAIALAEAEQ